MLFPHLVDVHAHVVDGVGDVAGDVVIPREVEGCKRIQYNDKQPEWWSVG